MSKFLSFVFRQHKNIFIVLLGFDVVMVVLHLAFAPHSEFFHLDHEQNLPTIYQSSKLILFGFLFMFISLTHKLSFRLKTFFFPLGLAITFLGFDELMQIHENIYKIFELTDWFHPSKIVESSMRMGYRSSLWIIYYLPLIFLFVLWCGYWLNHFQSKLKSNYWIMVVSIASLFLVLLMEVLSSTGNYSDHAYFWMVTVEEMAEMLLASTLILVGLKAFNRYLRVN